MPKIIIVGGVARSLLNFRGELIEEWLELGCEVVALAGQPTDELRQKLFAKGIVFRAIPLERDTINPFKDLKVLFSLIKIIREEKPKYLFCYTVKPVIYASLAARLFPSVSVYSMITGLGYAFARQSLKQNILEKAVRFLYRKALYSNETVFFQNPDDLKLFKQNGIISKQSKTVIVNGSGVNIDHFYFSKVKQKDTIVFLLIGRILRSKGIDDFIRASELVKSKYNNTTFQLLGPLSDGPDRISNAQLKSWVNRGIVEYQNEVEDVRPNLEECSVFVLPSYREGTPRSVLEAMAMGRPIITTDAPGCRETVEEGVNGFLVPVKDTEALVKAMEKFITDPDLIQKMGTESRRIAEQKFDVKKVNKVILGAMDLLHPDCIK